MIKPKAQCLYVDVTDGMVGRFDSWAKVAAHRRLSPLHWRIHRNTCGSYARGNTIRSTAVRARQERKSGVCSMTVTYLTEARTWLGVMRDIMPENVTVVMDHREASEVLARNAVSIVMTGIRCAVFTFEDGSQILSSGQVLKVIGS